MMHAEGYRKGAALALLGALLVSVVACSPSPEGALPGEREGAPSLRVGYMICDSLEETRRRFDPLNAFLSAATGLSLEPVYLNTFDIPELYEKGELDITHTNSLLYVIMHEQGLRPMAGEKRGSLGFRSAGGIVVRSESPVRQLADLAGKRMIFGPMLAPTGYLSPYELLLDAGLDPEGDLDYYSIPWGSHKHEKVVYGVWLGAFDAAAVPLLDLELMIAEGKVGEGDLRIVARNDPIPYCVFAASPRVEPGQFQALQNALFNLTSQDAVELEGERLLVLKAADVDGFVPIQDSDFQRVREMARKANMPPYQTF